MKGMLVAIKRDSGVYIGQIVEFCVEDAGVRWVNIDGRCVLKYDGFPCEKNKPFGGTFTETEFSRMVSEGKIVFIS